MLVFTLKEEWYNKILSGEKKIEYREVKPFWTKRINKALAVKNPDGTYIYPFTELPAQEVDLSSCPMPVVLRYECTMRRIEANVTKIEIVDGKDTDLHINAPVFAIHLSDVKEPHDCIVCLDKMRCGQYGGEGHVCGEWKKQWK